MSVPSPIIAFVGSYGSADEPNIAMFEVGEAALHRLGTYSGIENPSFLLVHPDGGTLYTVSETGRAGGGDEGAVHALRIGEEDGLPALSPLGHQSTHGDYPCHLAVDGEGRWLAASNYGTGSVALFPILAGGRLGAVTSLVEHSGVGPRRDRQEGPHAHSAAFTPDGRHLVVADLGIDRLVVYALDRDEGSLGRRGEFAAAPGAGPRHIVFHPDERHAFVVNELDNTLSVLDWDADSASLRQIQSVATVPPGAGESLAADVRVSRSGRHVYVSNRGDDSIAVFTFDPAGGIEQVAIGSSGGRWPRGIALVPGGHQMMVANRHSEEVALLPLCSGGSDLGAPAVSAFVRQPSCIVHL